MRDGDATRRRILDAASTEFAQRGIAGARVDRIAAAAKANKAQMYAYYGNKDDLFDAVFAAQVGAAIDEVPFTPDDLPGYAVRLHDGHRRRPDLMRLAMWRRLERSVEGEVTEQVADHDATKLEKIAQAQRDGAIDGSLSPAEVLAVVLALSLTFSPIGVPHAGIEDEDRRRDVIAEAVRRALAP
jgi:AcrR family transcriptional regulator